MDVEKFLEFLQLYDKFLEAYWIKNLEKFPLCPDADGTWPPRDFIGEISPEEEELYKPMECLLQLMKLRSQLPVVISEQEIMGQRAMESKKMSPAVDSDNRYHCLSS